MDTLIGGDAAWRWRWILKKVYAGGVLVRSGGVVFVRLQESQVGCAVRGMRSGSGDLPAIVLRLGALV